MEKKTLLIRWKITQILVENLNPYGIGLRLLKRMKYEIEIYKMDIIFP